MNKILRSERGASLIELISIIVVTSVIIIAAMVGVVAFYKSYRRISDFVAIQQEAMEMLVTMQNGIDAEGGEDANFMGIANAKSMRIINYSSFLNKGDGVELVPPKFTPSEQNDTMQFFKEGDVINAYWTYKGRSVGPYRLFPSEQYEDIVEIVDFYVSDPTRGDMFFSDRNLGIVEVNIEARVRLNDHPRPSQREYRSIHFKTLMARKA